MHRRGFLTAAASGTLVALAGCLTDAGTASAHPGISVDADPAPDDVSVTVSVERGFDSEGPARLRIALTNDASEDFSAIFGTVPPFTDLHGDQVGGEARLLLVPTDHDRKQRVVPETPIDGTWQATGDVATNATAITTDVPPGETIAQTYDLVAGPDTEALPAGDYRFEMPDYLGIETWGFTVSVAD